MQLCSKRMGARGIEPETFVRWGQLLCVDHRVLQPLDHMCALCSATTESANNRRLHVSHDRRLHVSHAVQELRPCMAPLIGCCCCPGSKLSAYMRMHAVCAADTHAGTHCGACVKTPPASHPLHGTDAASYQSSYQSSSSHMHARGLRMHFRGAHRNSCQTVHDSSIQTPFSPCSQHSASPSVPLACAYHMHVSRASSTWEWSPSTAAHSVTADSVAAGASAVRARFSAGPPSPLPASAAAAASRCHCHSRTLQSHAPVATAASVAATADTVSVWHSSLHTNATSEHEDISPKNGALTSGARNIRVSLLLGRRHLA